MSITSQTSHLKGLLTTHIGILVNLSTVWDIHSSKTQEGTNACFLSTFFTPQESLHLFTLLLSMINFWATRKSSFVSSFFENVFSPSMVVTLSKHLKPKTTKRTDSYSQWADYSQEACQSERFINFSSRQFYQHCEYLQ